MSDLTNSIKSPSATYNPATQEPVSTSDKLGLNNPVLWYSGGFIALFVVLALFDGEVLSHLVNVGFAWSVKVFGPFWQILLLLTFLIGLALAIGRTGRVVLGGIDTPELPNFRWMAILFCTLLAGGGVFWAAAEPIAHFVSAPPIYGATDNVQQRAINALSQSFMHWGFLGAVFLEQGF